jgi:hypothetical protein
MKQLLFLLFFVCSLAQAAITDLKLSTAQIFDVQWYISAGKLNASGFNYIYSSINYATQTASAARWTAAQTADAGSNGRYIGFFASTTNPGTYGMAVFNSDGTKYKIINNTGSFRALADGAIFYNGNGMWGTLITTAAGYSLGSSGQFTVTQDYPTNTQLQAYVPPSSTPLAAGQTAAPAAPALCCGGSSAAFSANASNVAKVMAFVDRTTTDTKVSIEQIGSSNTILVNQEGTVNNYAKYYSTGSNNNISIQQQANNAGQTNYVDLTVTGNSNTVDITQQTTNETNTFGKGVFASIADNNNTLTILQKNGGAHYVDVALAGGNKNVDITQQGNGNHMAKVGLTGMPTDLSLTQSGNTQQSYSINFNCATSGGCAKITVTQGQ